MHIYYYFYFFIACFYFLFLVFNYRNTLCKKKKNLICNHVQKFDISNCWKTLSSRIFFTKSVWKEHTLSNRQNIWKENTEKCYAVSSIAIFLLNSLAAKEKTSLFWKVDKWDYDDFSNFLPDLSENCFLWKEVTMALARFFFKSTWYIKVTFVLLSVWKLFSSFWYNQLWKKSRQIEYWC